MKSLYCDVCERHFYAKVSTPDEVALLKHGNKSKYHFNHKKEQVDDLSIRSSESEEFVLTSESSFIGLEERRLSVSVASEYLNHFSSPNYDAFSESSSVVGLSNFSTSSANNMYWNAMMSPEKTGLIDFSNKVGIDENKVPANVMTSFQFNDIYDKNFLIPKATKEEKGEFNTHLTVNTINLIEHLIKIFSKKESGSRSKLYSIGIILITLCRTPISITA
jgi:hypothetical protein